MDWAAIHFTYCRQAINRISGNIEKPSFDPFTDRHCDWLTCIGNLSTTYQTFGTIHRNGSNTILTEVLLNFKHEFVPVIPDQFKGV